MKRFIIKCTAFFLIIFMVFVPVSVILDPYNIFHATKLVNNGVEPDKNYIKPINVMRNMDKYDSLLFGSSRVGFLNVELFSDGKYYNMMASEGLPAEHLIILKTLIKKGFVPKNVVIGVDDISYFVEPSLHDDVLYRKMFPWDGTVTEKLGFYLRYMDPVTNFESIETMLENDSTDDEWGERLLTTGTENLEITPCFNPDNLKPYWASYYMPREEVFEEIQEIVDLCEEYNIELTFFTNPVFGYTYKQDIENGYLIFLEKLADITDYYNFSGLNDYTLDTKYYYENSHFSPEVGNAMIHILQGGTPDERLLSEGFGFHVTKDNVQELMEILKDQTINYDIEINTYKDTINKPDEEPSKE